MINDKYILGFDIRAIGKIDKTGLLESLIRQDVNAVISADPLVFPVVSHELERRLQSDAEPKENIVGLLSDLPTCCLIEDNECKIAVTTNKEIYEKLMDKFGVPLTTGSLSKETDLILDGWVMLGYDVIDINGLISGLSNCGAASQELKKEFAQHINKYSLFRDFSPALKFANKRSSEIPAHSPFHPAAIWAQKGKTGTAIRDA